MAWSRAVRYALAMICAAFDVSLDCMRLETDGTARVATRVMTRTTTIISMRVNPRALELSERREPVESRSLEQFRAKGMKVKENVRIEQPEFRRNWLQVSCPDVLGTDKACELARASNLAEIARSGPVRSR